jgi:hypothetical protein
VAQAAAAGHRTTSRIGTNDKLFQALKVLDPATRKPKDKTYAAACNHIDCGFGFKKEKFCVVLPFDSAGELKLLAGRCNKAVYTDGKLVARQCLAPGSPRTPPW